MLPPGSLLALSLQTHLGDVALVRQDYDLALGYYHQALRVDETRKDVRGRTRGWERLGRTFVDLKDYARAASYLTTPCGSSAGWRTPTALPTP